MTEAWTIDDPEQLSDFELSIEEQSDLVEAEAEVASVSYSGQDFDIDGLVRRLNNGDIKIPQFGHEDPSIDSAGFQRSFVWNRSQMDRFLESLLLGYPIPGIFLVRQTDNVFLVLDGQQRLRTLQHFYSGIFKDRTFALKNVAEKFEGLTYKTLPPELRRSLDNAFIQATIVAVSGDSENLDAIYQIFERLNSGGTQLTAHEIRVALFAGQFIDYLQDLNCDDNWRALYGPPNQRIRDQELVARILAMYVDVDEYARPQKTFLNTFVGSNRKSTRPEVLEAGILFRAAARLINEAEGAPALRRASRQVNNAWTDALFVGVMRRLSQTPLTTEEFSEAHQRLREDPTFQKFVTGPSADEELVRGRIAAAINAFRAA
jgi:hypothetical protein